MGHNYAQFHFMEVFKKQDYVKMNYDKGNIHAAIAEIGHMQNKNSMKRIIAMNKVRTADLTGVICI